MDTDGASVELRRQLEATMAYKVLSASKKQSLEQSLARVRPDEELLACGTARTIEGDGIKTSNYAFYFITNVGLYFSGMVKTGMFKSEPKLGFIASADLSTGDVQGARPGSGVDMGFLDCNNSSGQRTLWMSFDDVAGNTASPINLALNAGQALGLTF